MCFNHPASTWTPRSDQGVIPSETQIRVRRYFTVKNLTFAAILICFLLSIAGCGGDGTNTQPAGPSNNQVSGNVSDLNGNPIRDAKVFAVTKNGNITTFSNSAGSYVLKNVPKGTNIIYATISKNGTDFYGQNLAAVFDGERAASVNITMGPRGQMASIQGYAQDLGGNVLAGVYIYANFGQLGSTTFFTDQDGKFFLTGLFSGLTYDVFAGAQGFDSDTAQIALSPGEVRNLVFTLSDPNNPTFPAPTNLFATAWTSPAVATRIAQKGDPYEAIKNLVDPRRSKMRKSRFASRDTHSGNYIEIDLGWDQVQDVSLLGYGIYRGTNQNIPLDPVNVAIDPLTNFFADSDPVLRDGVTYYYQITALNVDYPNTPNSESLPSNRYGVKPLGDMTLGAVTNNPLTFHWNAASGATSYEVFVFDQYPDIGVNSIWNNSAAPVSGLSVKYGGPQLIKGSKYYYVVLGLANNKDSRTISPISSFIAN